MQENHQSTALEVRRRANHASLHDETWWKDYFESSFALVCRKIGELDEIVKRIYGDEASVSYRLAQGRSEQGILHLDLKLGSTLAFLRLVIKMGSISFADKGGAIKAHSPKSRSSSTAGSPFFEHIENMVIMFFSAIDQSRR